MTEPYVFDAFISYSRHDISFAARLERMLERYRPPRQLDLKRRLKIFRDVQDLVGNDLSVAVQTAIQGSRALIVVCSPQARSSDWVNEEIRLFADHHGTDRIIPILSSGVPNAEYVENGGPDSRAFPEQLLQCFDEPLAADFRLMGSRTLLNRMAQQREARYQLLAFLHDIDKETLIRRQAQRTSQLAVSATVLAAGLVIIFAWLAFTANRNSSLATARQLAAQSRLNLAEIDADATRSLLLAVESLKEKDTSEGWFAWRDAMQAMPTKIMERSHPDIEAVLSPTGRQLAVVEDQMLTFVSINNNEETAQLGLALPAQQMRYDPTGRHLVIAIGEQSYGQLKIYVLDALTGEVVVSVADYADEFTFSPDGAYLVITTIATLSVVDIEGKRWAGNIETNGSVESVNFEPDGQRFVIHRTGASTIDYYRTDPLQLEKTINVGNDQPGAGDVRAVQLSEDASTVAVARHIGVERWQTESKELLTQRGTLFIGELSFDSTSQYLASVFTDEFRMIEVNTGNDYRKGFPTEITTSSFSGTGKHFAIGLGNGDVYLWETAPGRLLAILPHVSPVRAIGFDNSEQPLLQLTTEEGSMEVWDTAGSATALILDHPKEVLSVDFSTDAAQIVTTARDGVLRIWGLPDGNLLNLVQVFEQPLLARYSPQGTWLLTAGSSGIALVFNVATGKQVKQLEHGEPMIINDFDLLGQRVSLKSANEVTVWDLDAADSTTLIRVRTETDGNGAALSPDGKWLATTSRSPNYSTSVWEVDSGERLAYLEQGGIAHDLDFSPDQRLLAGALADGTVTVWQAPDFSTLHSYTMPDEPTAIRFSPDGRRLAVSWYEGTVQIKEIPSWQDLATLTFDVTVDHLVWHPDSNRLAVGLRNGTVRLWDVDATNDVAIVDGGDVLFGLAFDHAGRFLASSGGTQAEVWAFQRQDLIDAACDRAARNLTTEEWRRYLPGQSQRATCEIGPATSDEFPIDLNIDDSSTVLEE